MTDLIIQLPNKSWRCTNVGRRAGG